MFNILFSLGVKSENTAALGFRATLIGQLAESRIAFTSINILHLYTIVCHSLVHTTCVHVWSSSQQKGLSLSFIRF